MTSELIIDAQPQEVTIALLEDEKLVEFQKEGQDSHYSVGNVYAGKVKKIMPALNACFVDVGHEREAFLHYQDLSSQFLALKKYTKQVVSDRKKLAPIAKVQGIPDLPKVGNIQDVLELGQEVMVQITKEPINTKGPRLTGEISFAGRFLVLIPFTDKVSVSTKIKSKEERVRLKQLIQSLKPRNFGVIVRTVAEGKRAAELNNELAILLGYWDNCIKKLQKANQLPALIHEETSRTVSMLRDLFNPSYESIHINDEDVFKEVQTYVSLIAPERAGIVKLYKGNIPIFDNFNVTKQIKSGLGRTISYKHGAYLIIEHTEALHVVDVNSGNRSRGIENQEDNAFEVNMGAATELARQLRLRDMGGIIVVDFIDMDSAEHRQKLYEHMTELMKNDRAKHTILPLSKFGLMQITRQRVRPAMDVHVEETCPTCFGKGTIQPSILFTDALESKIDYMVNNLGIKKFKLYVHPYVAAYINQGLLSLYIKWQMKYGFGLRLIPSQALGFLEYKFVDAKGNEVNMTEEIETQGMTNN
ncbi:MAG: Rne/Rng family ribonuclease [Bacteroidaceae bacterium]|nr:Rne/Rng family ribonuclease [Bacteroidaceae bacterium]MBP5523815.1 Rne/Rng family ribonuclease [Bacteroidaceae bacterium]MBQ4380210.1 Rne/Rng family ribonuclease [Bacteroidaceae bacterium]